MQQVLQKVHGGITTSYPLRFWQIDRLTDLPNDQPSNQPTDSWADGLIGENKIIPNSTFKHWHTKLVDLQNYYYVTHL